MGGDSAMLISAHLDVSAGARCDDTRVSEPFPMGFVSDGSADLDAALALSHCATRRPAFTGRRAEVAIQALGRRPAESLQIVEWQHHGSTADVHARGVRPRRALR